MTTRTNRERPAELPPIEDVALRILGARDHSRLELRNKLLRRGYAEDAVEALIARFCELRYLDDARFAKSLVRERLGVRARGVHDAALRLRRAGIAGDEAKNALSEIGLEIDGKEVLLRLAIKKIALLKHEESGKRRSKLARFLLARGFSGEAVREVVDRLLSASADDAYEKEIDDDDDGA